MSQEKILKTLVNLGLKQLDAKVYIYLAKKGPKKARDTAKALKISKQRLYPSIKNLQGKGIVNATLEHPARFSAVPLEKVLDLFVKAKLEETKRIQRNKDEILSDWQSITIAESDSSPAKFTVIEGRRYVYSKIQQMVQDTREQLSFVATVPSLARADQFGLFDAAFNHPLKSKIRFRFLTELSGQNANAIKALLKKKPKAGFNLEGKTPDLGLKLCPRMVIRDEEETVFFIDPRKGEFSSEQDDVCLWTNCKSLVHSFLAMFEELWRNSTDIEQKIVEIETGKPTPKMFLIKDAETAKRKYDEALSNATNEILMMTSSMGLIEFCRNKRLVTECTGRGVLVRIMAPITGENLKAVQQLVDCCEVRHVAIGYLGTTIVDGQHLFQFKNPPSDQRKPKALSYLENTFYTNDHEYVEKTRNMLNAIWKNSRIPSAVTLVSVIRPPTRPTAPPDSVLRGRGIKICKKASDFNIIDEEKLGALTEKDVLNKIINAKKYLVKNSSKDIDRMYATTGVAVIHPPDYFNLPDMMIWVFHVEKQSSYGEEDFITVFLWLETPKGYAYVPVANVGDNPKGVAYRRDVYAGTPAAQNSIMVKKDELQVRVHGSTLFAGWTVQIPLLPPRYSLPPACILIEGYGDIKTVAYTLVSPSGYKSMVEQNYLDAFVTFIHPSSKYTGPGTEGLFGRDFVMTTHPPQTNNRL